MNSDVAVGLLIGAVIGTSTYVWKSNNFTKEQKTLLFVCIIFPPLQWLLILLLLLYNNFKSNNTPQKINEKTLDKNKSNLNSSIDNLTDLKMKGIITDSEYNEKVKNIEAKKSELDLLNSKEYKQLKSLLDSGILMKDEFESKIGILSNTQFTFKEDKSFDKDFNIDFASIFLKFTLLLRWVLGLLFILSFVSSLYTFYATDFHINLIVSLIFFLLGMAMIPPVTTKIMRFFKVKK